MQTFREKQEYDHDSCHKMMVEKYWNYRCYAHECGLGKGHKGPHCCSRCGKMFFVTEKGESKTCKSQSLFRF